MKNITRLTIFLTVASTVFSHSVWGQSKLKFIQRATSQSPRKSTDVSRTKAAAELPRILTSQVQGRNRPEGSPRFKPKYYYFNHAAGQTEGGAPRLLNFRAGKIRTSARAIEPRPVSNRRVEFSTTTSREVDFPVGTAMSEVPRFEPALPDSTQSNSRSYPYLGGIPTFTHRHCPQYWGNPWVGYCEELMLHRFEHGCSVCSYCGCCDSAYCRWRVGDAELLNYRGDGCGCVAEPPFAFDLEDGEAAPFSKTTPSPLPKTTPLPPSRRRPPKNDLPPPLLEPANGQ